MDPWIPIELMTESIEHRWRACIDGINTRGIDALDDLVSLYADDFVFVDSIQTLYGRASYRAMNARLLSRVRSLRIELDDVLADDRRMMAVGRMIVRSKVGAEVVVHGSMCMRIGPDGAITYQRDYMDLATSVLDAVPVLGPLYRRAVVAVLG